MQAQITKHHRTAVGGKHKNGSSARKRVIFDCVLFTTRVHLMREMCSTTYVVGTSFFTICLISWDSPGNRLIRREPLGSHPEDRPKEGMVFE